MKKFTVFTKNNCPGCDNLKVILDNNDIEYDTINIEENKKAYDLVIEMGFAATPVLLDNETKSAVGGFNPPAIFGLLGL